MSDENQASAAGTTKFEPSLEKLRERHKVLSITVRRTMFALLAYSVSCGVIIAQPDVPFVLTSSGVQIPVINVAVNLNAFLLVGPIVLLAITIYLHIFLAKLNRISELDEYDMQPFLFNFNDRLSRLLGFLIFYITPILLMIAFSWKSAVTEWRGFLFFATGVVIVGLLLLYLKSRLNLKRHFIVISSVVALAGLILISYVLSEHLRPRRLNLEGANLAGIHFRKVNLTRANLNYANLTKAILSSNTLTRANLRNANLSEANLQNAKLQGADLHGADLRGANLENAELHLASLHGTKIDGHTKLDHKWKLVWRLVNEVEHSIDLKNADLSKADLSGSNLNRIPMIKAKLFESNLRYTTLHETKLDTADLHDADLRGADLVGTELCGANLSGASLRHVNLSGAKGLTTEQLCQAEMIELPKWEPELKKRTEKKCPERFVEKRKAAGLDRTTISN